MEIVAAARSAHAWTSFEFLSELHSVVYSYKSGYNMQNPSILPSLYVRGTFYQIGFDVVRQNQSTFKDLVKIVIFF